MRGYLNKSEATAEALRDGGMHSGDAGIIDAAGVVPLLDRILKSGLREPHWQGHARRVN